MSEEKEFEEEFPSLKDKIDCQDEDYDFIAKKMMHPHVYCEDIQKHCLDKQRVKEAMTNLDEELKSWYDRTTADWVIDWFKKELGLED